MDIGRRLREVREAKSLSQGEIEERTGLLRSYISRVENGHTIPSIETLEKIARALDTPIYVIFYDQKPPRIEQSDLNDWASDLRGQRLFNRLRRALAQMEAANRLLLFQVAQKIVSGKRAKKPE